MTTPVPDELLAVYAKWGDGPVWDIVAGLPVTSVNILQATCAETRMTGALLAKQLLAAREALRLVWGAMIDVAEGRDGPGEGWAQECADQIAACLPEKAAPGA